MLLLRSFRTVCCCFYFVSTSSTYETGIRWLSTAWLRNRVGRRVGVTAQSGVGTGVFENCGGRAQGAASWPS
jgi:hypothetical protein